jgi:ATP-dependent DNA helicase DinG
VSTPRFKIPWGFWRSRNDLVQPSYDLPHARLLQEGDAYECPACQGVLKLAKGQVVQPYFAHNPAGYTAASLHTCAEETALHKIAKLLLVKAVREWVAGGPAPMIERRCGRCLRSVTTTPPAATAGAVEEFLNGDRIHDVALLDTGGVPLMFLEVYVTHRTQPGIQSPWLELAAKSVIEDPLTWTPMGSGNLEVIQSCQHCVEEEQSGYQDVDPLNPVLNDVVEDVFGQGGRLSQIMEGYEERPSQKEFARAIDSAIREQKSLLGEAPCGTGKSMAYLATTVTHAMHSGGKVLVSTANKALQHQLHEKDLPLLERVLDREINHTLMKGRSNYICQERLAQWASKTRAGQDHPLVSWAAMSHDGDYERSEVSDWDPRELRQVCGSQEACADKCAKSECFYQKAKARAREADVVVTNHKQLFAHLVWRRKLGRDIVLPKAMVTVCDEGHELAECARDFFEISVTEGYNRRLCLGSGSKRRTSAELEAEENLVNAEIEFFRVAKRVLARDPNVKAPWINGAAEAQGQAFIQAARAATALWEECHSRALLMDDEEEVQQAEKGLEKIQGLVDRLESICHMKPDETTDAEMAFWYETTRGDRGQIKACPVEVSQFIHDNLFSPPATTIVTSATLTTSGSFDYVIRDLGFEGSYLAVDSPFDFSRQSLLILPTDQDMPVDPSGKDRKEFLKHSARLFHEIASYTGGGVLFLFTARSSMRQVRDMIDRHFPYRVLVQDDMPKNKLVEAFKEDKNSCLFGLASFWAGLDVPGDALRCVVIEKLPFCTPSDPFYRYWIGKKGKKQASVDYMIQRAMIQIRQGAGRLIRSSSDRGVLVMLDRRIRPRQGAWSDYGKYMIPSVPWPHQWGVGSVRQFFQGQPCPS